MGPVSAGVVCDMLMLYIVQSRLRAHTTPSAAVPSQLQPPTPVKPMKFIHRDMRWSAQVFPHQMGERVLQLPHMFVVTALVAFVGLCCASRGARMAGVSKRPWQSKAAKKNKFEDKLVPWKYQEHEEPDAEPRVRNGKSSKLGTNLMRSRSDFCLPSQANDGVPLVPVKMLAPKCPVASATDEPENQDFMGSGHGPVPGTAGFVAEQTAEVERVLQIFRMHSEGSAQLVDEDGIEELTRELQVVPDGLVRSCTVELERRIEERVLQIFRMHSEGSMQLVDEDGLQVVPEGLVCACTVELERRIEHNPNSFPRRVSIS